LRFPTKRGLARGLGLLALLVVAVPAIIYFGFPQFLVEREFASLRRAGGLERREVAVGGDTIVYLERMGDARGAGTDAELPIVLVHGFGGDKDNWSRFSRYLPRRYRVIALDLPGFGESSKRADAHYRVWDQVERLHAFLERLGLRRYHLAGNSMGGAIALAHAIRYPGEVATLGLVASGGVRSPEKSDVAKMHAAGVNPLLVDSRGDFDALMAMLFVEPPWIPGTVRTYLAGRAKANRLRHQKIFAELMSPGGGFFELEPLLPQVQARTLVLWGDSDRLLHVSAVRVFEAGLQHEKTVILQRCGHVPMIEQAAKTAEHYLAFLAAGVEAQTQR
jgi:pimeloyl-ACP methyl ester carboxylesterase